MKNITFIFLLISFISCSKQETLTTNWFGSQIVGNSYVIHNRTTNMVDYEWAFEDGTIYERNILNNSYYFHSPVKRGEWGILYKGEYTVGMWVDTPEMGYKEFDFDFSGKDIIFIEKSNDENRYFAEFVDW
jgi:hypothetical protein